ncbi:MAG: hypothetical protein ABIS50_02425 [Luteolibacter sp.]|uniref:hypothetical protein n=1 Tax=Luteolibacter sp. TaxID=1962973 RepID=UPI003265A53F
MSDSETDPLSSLLSSFALGPAWARAAGDKQEQKPKAFSGGEDRPPRRDDRGPRQGGSRDRDGGERRPFQGGRGGNQDDRRNAPPRFEEAAPEEGVRATIAPDPQAVHLIGKEVHQVARVYPLFDVAKILLAEKARCRAIFEAPLPHAPLVRGKLDESLFLTRDEAIRHLWNSDLRNDQIEEETIEVDPPTGNFQAIARCGISGEWLGPVNFHSYQTNLRRLHRERFAKMPFELYAAKVRTERGEEAVNAWLETMKKKTRWRIKGDGDEAWIDDRAAAERAVAERCFDKAFEETRIAEVSGAILAKNLSPSLLTSLKIAGSHARKHPAILIPAVCRAVEAEHLPVFKRQGKLHTGPARPHPLPANAILAERPGKMVAWIRENSPAKLEGLWKSVLPEGSTAPPAEYAADLFWLLHQGHILLYTDDTLVVQEAREAAAAEAGAEVKKAKKKKKNKKPKPAAEIKEGEVAGGESPLAEASAEVATTAPETPEVSVPEVAEPVAVEVIPAEPVAAEAPEPVAESPAPVAVEESVVIKPEEKEQPPAAD